MHSHTRILWKVFRMSYATVRMVSRNSEISRTLLSAVPGWGQFKITIQSRLKPLSNFVLWRNSPLLDSHSLDTRFVATDTLVEVKALPRDWHIFRTDNNRQSSNFAKSNKREFIYEFIDSIIREPRRIHSQESRHSTFDVRNSEVAHS
jgi:hypothetical protein